MLVSIILTSKDKKHSPIINETFGKLLCELTLDDKNNSVDIQSLRTIKHDDMSCISETELVFTCDDEIKALGSVANTLIYLIQSNQLFRDDYFKRASVKNSYLDLTMDAEGIKFSKEALYNIADIGCKTNHNGKGIKDLYN